MPTDYISILHQLGLADSEARVYLAALELGPSAVQEIAGRAKLSRTAAYEAIELLSRRGLFATFEKGKKTMYAAEDPDSLLEYLKQRESNFHNQVEKIQGNLQDLRLLAGGEKPVVKFAQGKEALRVLFEHMRDIQPKEIIEISNYDDIL